MKLPSLAVIALFVAAASLRADTFHVAVDGVDTTDRTGKSPETAWASLAFACEQVPAGEHVIQLGSGTFTATRQAVPKSGFTIQGQGATGTDATRLVASTDWKLTREIGEEDDDARNMHEYLIAFRRGENITVRAMELSSLPEHRITGGFFCRDGKRVLLEDLAVRHFRWNGLRVEFSEHVTIRGCALEDTSSVKRGGSEGGHIRTRWISNSRIHENRIISTDGRGYGYKAGGHVNVRIDHNFIDTGYFAIESAHEGEYGVEIDRNHLTRCISVPKSGQSQNPNERGHAYTFWIHDNLLTDSYTVEGPRNHLRLSHNYIRIEKTGGRVYTHHGGINHGPVSIDHNVIENVDRAVVWMNNGLAEGIQVVHNTITCANAGDRAGRLFDSYSQERLNNWVVKNNVIAAPENQRRSLFPTERGVPAKIAAEGNYLVNVDGPAGNHVGESPSFTLRGDKPWAYYEPAPGNQQLVDRGVELTKPFWGEAFTFVGELPDIGAVERGARLPPWDVPHGHAERKSANR